MSREMLADDIVIALLHYVRTRGRRFTADRERLHRAFYFLKTQDPKPLHVLGFRHRGLFPESPELDQAMANLEAAGLLRRFNETPKFYVIQSELDRAFRHFVRPRINSAKIADARIQKLATAFVANTAYRR